MATSKWTAERRARQAEAIRRWKPWTKSTGPKTETGKAASSANRARSIQAVQDEIREASKLLAEAEARLERMTGR